MGDYHCAGELQVKAEGEEKKLVEKIRCCIYTRCPDGSIEQCWHFAFTPMTKELVDVATKKCLPLLYDSRNPNTLLICVAHRRLIMNIGKYNESQGKALNLGSYDVGEEKELLEFLDEFASYKRDIAASGQQQYSHSEEAFIPPDRKLHKKVFNSAYHNLWRRYRSYEDRYATREMPGGSRAMGECRKRSLDDTDSDEDASRRMAHTLALEDERLNFDALSKEALKRYTKHANLPLRATVNSRRSLVEGVRDHVEKSIHVPDQTQVAANFLWNVRSKRNKLDFSTGVSSSVFAGPTRSTGASARRNTPTN